MPSQDIQTDISASLHAKNSGDGKIPSCVVEHVDASYFEENAGGAPTEKKSPLGYDVGIVSAIMLNVSQMIGSGIFSTPGTIFKSVGSPGLSIIFWVIGSIIAFSGLAVYTELAATFPKRSGAEVVYLEQAYPRPKFFFPVTFAVTTVLLSFSATNAIVFAEYIMTAAGRHEVSTVTTRVVAISVVTGSSILCILSTRWSLRLVNLLSIIKLVTLLFIVITGFVVLGGKTRVEDPLVNFRSSFANTTSNGNGIATALVKVNFAYTGWSNANNVLGEMSDPVRTVKRAGFSALAVVSMLYILANVAYFAAVPKADIASSGQLIAAIFFDNVFGSSAATRGLPSLIAISALGNIIAVIIGQARVLREIGRQGVLPFPEFWSSTKPFGTPAAPILLKWALTILILVAIPTGDAFNFLLDLASYPSLIFSFATALGVYILRRRLKQQGLPAPAFRAWHVSIVLTLLAAVFLLAMPW